MLAMPHGPTYNRTQDGIEKQRMAQPGQMQLTAASPSLFARGLARLTLLVLRRRQLIWSAVGASSRLEPHDKAHTYSEAVWIRSGAITDVPGLDVAILFCERLDVWPG